MKKKVFGYVISVMKAFPTKRLNFVVKIVIILYVLVVLGKMKENLIRIKEKKKQQFQILIRNLTWRIFLQKVKEKLV